MASEVLRQFDYRADIRGLKLLGVLSIIMAPLCFWVSLQPDDNPDIWIAGFHFTGPVVSWLERLLAVLLVLIGIALYKGANQSRGKIFKLTFTKTGLVMPGDLQSEIPYTDISNIHEFRYKRKPAFTFSRTGGKMMLCSSQMKSLAEFEEARTLLSQHAGKTSTL